MEHIKKVISVSIILSLYMSFLAYANEGMVVSTPIERNEIEQVYYYRNVDYSCAKNEWKQVWDNWYYFGEDGKSIQNTWAEIDGKWYYFDQWSIMLHDTTTPDGYYVGSDGAWVQEEAATQQKLQRLRARRDPRSFVFHG